MLTFCPFEKQFMTGTVLHTNEILQYLVLDKIVIIFTAKNLMELCVKFNADICNKYAYLWCVAKLFLFQYTLLDYICVHTLLKYCLKNLPSSFNTIPKAVGFQIIQQTDFVFTYIIGGGGLPQLDCKIWSKMVHYGVLL